MTNNIMILSVILINYISFLNIHTINSYGINYVIWLCTLLFIIKRYYNVALTIIGSFYLADNLWIICNNIMKQYTLHYPIASDILTMIILSLISTLCVFKIKKNTIVLSLLVVLFFVYPYMPYKRYLYWISLSYIPIFITYILAKRPYKISNKYLLVACIVILFVAITHNMSKKINNIAVLQSSWCDVSKNPDKTSFTMDYYYAYSDFYKVLNSYANVDIIDYSDILDKKIKHYDILILITPTKAFSNNEIETLQRYIWRGGKIVVIADHTNLYGHADVLNPLLHGVGAHLADDTLYDNFDYYKNYLININSSTLKQMYTKTNSSLHLPFYADIWGIADNVISERADYTKENFFGDLSFTEDDTVGSFPIGATIPYGLGKVVIWTDSTLFSNFAISQINSLYLLDYIILGTVLNDNVRDLPYHKVNIIAQKEMLREAPPRHLPNEEHYSTLIANLTRYNYFPLYNAKNHQNKQLYFLKYNELVRNLDEFMQHKYYVVITNDIPAENIFGAKKTDIRQEKVATNQENNYFYSVGKNRITTKLGETRILFGKNVLSDNELGTWWNTIPVSPYKQYILQKFSNWLSDNKEIEFFNYPELNVALNNITWIYDDAYKENYEELKISKPISVNGYSFVYMGDRSWAILLDNGNLLGGEETCDNNKYKKRGKWTIKSHD